MHESTDLACNRRQAPIVLELGSCFFSDWQGNNFMPHYTGQTAICWCKSHSGTECVFMANQFPKHRIWKDLCSLSCYCMNMTDRDGTSRETWFSAENLVIFMFDYSLQFSFSTLRRIRDLSTEYDFQCFSISHKNYCGEVRSHNCIVELSYESDEKDFKNKQQQKISIHPCVHELTSCQYILVPQHLTQTLLRCATSKALMLEWSVSLVSPIHTPNTSLLFYRPSRQDSGFRSGRLSNT